MEYKELPQNLINNLSVDQVAHIQHQFEIAANNMLVRKFEEHAKYDEILELNFVIAIVWFIPTLGEQKPITIQWVRGVAQYYEDHRSAAYRAELNMKLEWLRRHIFKAFSNGFYKSSDDENILIDMSRLNEFKCFVNPEKYVRINDDRSVEKLIK